MKYSILKFLEDRETREEFNVFVFEERNNPTSADGKEIVYGYLKSPNGSKWYPIIDEIPIFVPNAVLFYKEFFEQFAEKLPPPCFTDDEIEKYNFIQLRVQKGFGHEWLKFTRLLGYHDREPFEIVGLNIKKDFNNKFIFDGGCGYARHCYALMEGGEVQNSEALICDISAAVWSAKKNLSHRKDVHIMQADLTNLQVKANYFDFVYSLGVLQHTPDPHYTFMQLSSLTKEGGMIETGVYEIKHPLGHFVERVLRKFTTRLPEKWLWAISYLAVIPNFFFYKLGFQHIPGLNQFIRVLIRTNPSWKCSQVDTYDWYMAPYQRRYKIGTTEAWFQEAGYENLVRDKLGYGCVLGQKRKGAPNTRNVPKLEVPKEFDGVTILS